MSLLNNALKEAEQRQNRPSPSPYPGLGSAAPAVRRGSRLLLLAAGLLVVAGIIGYASWQFVATPGIPAAGEARQASLEQVTPTAAPEEAAVEPQFGVVVDVAQATGQPDRDEAVVSAQVSDPVEAVAESDEPAFRESEPLVASPPQSVERPSGSEAATPAQPQESVAEVQVSGPGQDSRPDRQPTVEEAEQREAPVTGSGPGQPVSRQASAEPQAQPAVAADIKQTRQTPAQRDLSASRDIRELIGDGDLVAAEAKLAALTDRQTAPQSRYAFARGVLAGGDAQRALAWLPKDLTERNPDLRLIRARALLAGGDLGQAVATLQSGVPTVAGNVEYRVTLATLLQQQGHSGEAANHWAELIAWDNGQAPWWVGLAIALEGRGDVPAARRAYQQAAALPGLPPSLADYVRQRLQTLGAG